MLSFLKVKEPLVVSVEEIHNEIDAAEDKVMTELNTLLESQKVDMSSSIHRKAEKLAALGFEKSAGLTVSRTLGKTEVELARYHHIKYAYPNEKILTVKEFNRILDKYNLVFAPASEYINDVPEKVVNTLMKAKKRERNHTPLNFYKVTKLVLHSSTQLSRRGKRKVRKYLSENLITDTDTFYTRVIEDALKKAFKINFNLGISSETKSIVVDRKCLQIAAPGSHFNPKYFESLNQTCKLVVTPDPIAFEFIQEGFVRILDKWGTEDDQSYLDPALTNENHN